MPNPITHPLHIDPLNVIYGKPGKFSLIANHTFQVCPSNNPYTPIQTIQFQDGPTNEAHIDGVHNEDLLLMVLNRLGAYQTSPYACRENALAITHIETALMFLCKRTQERRQRKVEGTSTR